MKRVACWFLAAVVSAAAAGAAAGMVLCRRMPPPGGGLQPGDRRVVEDYAADFRLSAEQTELLRAILRTLRDEEAAIYRHNRAKLPPELLDQLSAARRAAETRIRFMLDADQRARYEQRRASENDKR
ncbi:MAG TPA: hypothetical protein VK081_01880 [Planctomycetota bacterium]|nr:hypothetical protein [Planctomycetota bacterium]